MIFGTLNPEKISHEVLTDFPPHLPAVATLPWEIQKKSFSTVLFIHTSDYLRYHRRKQTVIYLPTPSENVTTLYKLVNCKTHSSDWRFISFFQTLEALKRASCGLSSLALKRTGCDVWQLECHASNVTPSVQSDHLLH